MATAVDGEDWIECTWEVFPGSMETPPEICGLEIEGDGEWCLKHQEITDKLDAWENGKGESE